MEGVASSTPSICECPFEPALACAAETRLSIPLLDVPLVVPYAIVLEEVEDEDEDGDEPVECLLNDDDFRSEE